MRPQLIWINGHYGLKRKGYQHVGSKAVKISVILKLKACAKSQETRRERGMEGGLGGVGGGDGRGVRRCLFQCPAPTVRAEFLH